MIKFITNIYFNVILYWIITEEGKRKKPS